MFIKENDDVDDNHDDDDDDDDNDGDRYIKHTFLFLIWHHYCW